jgi:membrane-associated phospholipid phosphatase
MHPTDRGDQDPSSTQNGSTAPATEAPGSTVAAPSPPPVGNTPHSVRHPSLAVALAVGIAGLGVNLLGLKLSERLVPWFPSVPDVIQARLPYVDFGLPGELVFIAFFVTSVGLLIARQPRSVPSVICLVGVFFAIRGVFLFLLPIGSPPTAPAVLHRFVLYPYASHAYFPGGHAGLMTILSLSLEDPLWRRVLLAATVVFAVGSVMARAHYTADVIAGGALGYALVSWGRRNLAHLSSRTLTPPARPAS